MELLLRLVICNLLWWAVPMAIKFSDPINSSISSTVSRNLNPQQLQHLHTMYVLHPRDRKNANELHFKKSRHLWIFLANGNSTSEIDSLLHKVQSIDRINQNVLLSGDLNRNVSDSKPEMKMRQKTEEGEINSEFSERRTAIEEFLLARLNKAGQSKVRPRRTRKPKLLWKKRKPVGATRHPYDQFAVVKLYPKAIKVGVAVIKSVYILAKEHFRKAGKTFQKSTGYAKDGILPGVNRTVNNGGNNLNGAFGGSKLGGFNSNNGGASSNKNQGINGNNGRLPSNTAGSSTDSNIVNNPDFINNGRQTPQQPPNPNAYTRVNREAEIPELENKVYKRNVRHGTPRQTWVHINERNIRLPQSPRIRPRTFNPPRNRMPNRNGWKPRQNVNNRIHQKVVIQGGNINNDGNAPRIIQGGNIVNDVGESRDTSEESEEINFQGNVHKSQFNLVEGDTGEIVTDSEAPSQTPNNHQNKNNMLFQGKNENENALAFQGSNYGNQKTVVQSGNLPIQGSINGFVQGTNVENKDREDVLQGGNLASSAGAGNTVAVNQLEVERISSEIQLTMGPNGQRRYDLNHAINGVNLNSGRTTDSGVQGGNSVNKMTVGYTSNGNTYNPYVGIQGGGGSVNFWNQGVQIKNSQIEGANSVTGFQGGNVNYKNQYDHNRIQNFQNSQIQGATGISGVQGGNLQFKNQYGNNGIQSSSQNTQNLVPNFQNSQIQGGNGIRGFQGGNLQFKNQYGNNGIQSNNQSPYSPVAKFENSQIQGGNLNFANSAGYSNIGVQGGNQNLGIQSSNFQNSHIQSGNGNGMNGIQGGNLNLGSGLEGGNQNFEIRNAQIENGQIHGGMGVNGIHGANRNLGNQMLNGIQGGNRNNNYDPSNNNIGTAETVQGLNGIQGSNAKKVESQSNQRYFGIQGSNVKANSFGLQGGNGWSESYGPAGDSIDNSDSKGLQGGNLISGISEVSLSNGYQGGTLFNGGVLGGNSKNGLQGGNLDGGIIGGNLNNGFRGGNLDDGIRDGNTNNGIQGSNINQENVIQGANINLGIQGSNGYENVIQGGNIKSGIQGGNWNGANGIRGSSMNPGIQGNNGHLQEYGIQGSNAGPQYFGSMNDKGEDVVIHGGNVKGGIRGGNSNTEQNVVHGGNLHVGGIHGSNTNQEGDGFQGGDVNSGKYVNFPKQSGDSTNGLQAGNGPDQTNGGNTAQQVVLGEGVHSGNLDRPPGGLSNNGTLSIDVVASVEWLKAKVQNIIERIFESEEFESFEQVALIAIDLLGVLFDWNTLHRAKNCLYSHYINKRLCLEGVDGCIEEYQICAGRNPVVEYSNAVIQLPLSVLCILVFMAFPQFSPFLALFQLFVIYIVSRLQSHEVVANFEKYLPMTVTERRQHLTFGSSLYGLGIDDRLLTLREQAKFNGHILHDMASFLHHPESEDLFWATFRPAHNTLLRVKPIWHEDNCEARAAIDGRYNHLVQAAYRISASLGRLLELLDLKVKDLVKHLTVGPCEDSVLVFDYPPYLDNYVDVSYGTFDLRTFKRWSPNPHEFTGHHKQSKFDSESFICRPAGSTGTYWKQHYPWLAGPSHKCVNALGYKSHDRPAERFALFDLGDGNDTAIGFEGLRNFFHVESGQKEYIGGAKNDYFCLEGDAMTSGLLSGGAGIDTLEITGDDDNIVNLLIDKLTNSPITGNLNIRPFGNLFQALNVPGIASGIASGINSIGSGIGSGISNLFRPTSTMAPSTMPGNNQGNNGGPTPENTGPTPDNTGSTPDNTGSTPDNTGPTPDNTGSTPDNTGSTPDNTGSTPDNTGPMPDNTGSTPDIVGSTPGNGGTAPGNVGSTPGNLGSTPGNGGTAPGNVGSTPGNVGSTPGNVGSTPGNGGNIPGIGGSTPGNGASTPGNGDLLPDLEVDIPGTGGSTPGNGDLLPDLEVDIPGTGGDTPAIGVNILGTGGSMSGTGRDIPAKPVSGRDIPGPVGPISKPLGTLPETGKGIPGPVGPISKPVGTLPETGKRIPGPVGPISKPAGTLLETGKNISGPVGPLPRPVVTLSGTAGLIPGTVGVMPGPVGPMVGSILGSLRGPNNLVSTSTDELAAATGASGVLDYVIQNYRVNETPMIISATGAPSGTKFVEAITDGSATTATMMTEIVSTLSPTMPSVIDDTIGAIDDLFSAGNLTLTKVKPMHSSVRLVLPQEVIRPTHVIFPYIVNRTTSLNPSPENSNLPDITVSYLITVNAPERPIDVQLHTSNLDPSPDDEHTRESTSGSNKTPRIEEFTSAVTPTPARNIPSVIISPSKANKRESRQFFSTTTSLPNFPGLRLDSIEIILGRAGAPERIRSACGVTRIDGQGGSRNSPDILELGMRNTCPGGSPRELRVDVSGNTLVRNYNQDPSMTYNYYIKNGEDRSGRLFNRQCTGCGCRHIFGLSSNLPTNLLNAGIGLLNSALSIIGLGTGGQGQNAGAGTTGTGTQMAGPQMAGPQGAGAGGAAGRKRRQTVSSLQTIGISVDGNLATPNTALHYIYMLTPVSALKRIQYRVLDRLFNFDIGTSYTMSMLRLSTSSNARVRTIDEAELNIIGRLPGELVFNFNLSSSIFPFVIGAKGFVNIFNINSSYLTVTGGNMNDIFSIGPGARVGAINGGSSGSNTIMMDKGMQNKYMFDLANKVVTFPGGGEPTRLFGAFHNIMGRVNVGDALVTCCDTKIVDLKNGGPRDMDQILIQRQNTACNASIVMVVQVLPFTNVTNKNSDPGQFYYNIRRPDATARSIDPRGARLLDFTESNNSYHRIQFEYDPKDFTQLTFHPDTRNVRAFADDLDLSVTLSLVASIQHPDTTFNLKEDYVGIILSNEHTQGEDWREKGRIEPIFKFSLNFPPDSKTQIAGGKFNSNHFYINNQYKFIEGGAQRDVFIMETNGRVGTINGGGGHDVLLFKNSFQYENQNTAPSQEVTLDASNKGSFRYVVPYTEGQHMVRLANAKINSNSNSNSFPRTARVSFYEFMQLKETMASRTELNGNEKGGKQDFTLFFELLSSLYDIENIVAHAHTSSTLITFTDNHKSSFTVLHLQTSKGPYSAFPRKSQNSNSNPHKRSPPHLFSFITKDDYEITTDPLGTITAEKRFKNNQVRSGTRQDVLRIIDGNADIANHLGITLLVTIVTEEGHILKRIQIEGSDKMKYLTNQWTVETHLVGNSHANVFSIAPTFSQNKIPIHVYLGNGKGEDVDLLEYIFGENERGEGPLNLIDFSSFYNERPIAVDMADYKAHYLVPRVKQAGDDLVITVSYKNPKPSFKQRRMEEETVVFVNGARQYKRMFVKMYSILYEFHPSPGEGPQSSQTLTFGATSKPLSWELRPRQIKSKLKSNDKSVVESKVPSQIPSHWQDFNSKESREKVSDSEAESDEGGQPLLMPFQGAFNYQNHLSVPMMKGKKGKYPVPASAFYIKPNRSPIIPANSYVLVPAQDIQRDVLGLGWQVVVPVIQ